MLDYVAASMFSQQMTGILGQPAVLKQGKEETSGFLYSYRVYPSPVPFIRTQTRVEITIELNSGGLISRSWPLEQIQGISENRVSFTLDFGQDDTETSLTVDTRVEG